ncbi:lysosomal membrane ascorbate-dependent ferrireductase CYB561A3-like [Chrysoperla carnea]|uniref:lysosomal membrane ascorbate-dependent ferrireductase CYB561A3-like n=1 Tax=Chrysoperla carnea TaxID=189513 RepID=UPI001D0957D9|nr:lysosomal membrane ascorbate-dependent ferrireductase CYB561A3-like [Chrysoperla carnea]
MNEVQNINAISRTSSSSSSLSNSEVRNLLTMEQIEENRSNLIGFNLLVWITEGLGIILFCLVLFWSIHFGGGFAWSSDLNLQFNWHPFFMVTGMVILYSQSILIYRIFREKRKRQLKILHAALHGIVFLLAVIALKAVFDNHNYSTPPKPNLYSLHSWMGLTTVILFACQYVSGFVTFLYPGLQLSVKVLYMPVHVFFGLAGFVMAVATCIIGLNEKAFLKLSATYGDLPSEGLLVNFIGTILLIFSFFVIYIVTKYEYKRFAKDEDGNLLTGRQD